MTANADPARRERTAAPTSVSGGWAPPLLVALVTLATFAPAIRNEFVNWDDQLNFTHNPHYPGLSWANLRWMFTTFHLGPYQPLSWLSLAADAVVWGPTSAAHHFFNIAYHTLAAVTLYFVALRLLSLATRLPRDDSRCRISAAVAALFSAVQPLRAESVAWASERRDVLSGFLVVATVLLYLRACERPTTRRFAAAVIVFTFSLLAKAGGMTLPIVMLLLDYYPLRRFGSNRVPVRRVFLEKLGFAIPAVAAGLLAWMGQRQLGAFKTLVDLDLLARLKIAAYGSWFYVIKSVWPTDLHPFYTLPENVELRRPIYWAALGASILVSGVAASQWRRRPWLATAWFSYLALLAPVSGLAQAGPQMAADRYSYLPGMVLGVAAGGMMLAAGRRLPRTNPESRAWRATIGLAAAATCVLAGLTSAQVRWWSNSITLWERVLAYEPRNKFARANLAAAFVRRGDAASALREYELTARDFPDDAAAQASLSSMLLHVGRIDDAVAAGRRAAALDPDSHDAQRCLGAALLAAGQVNEALPSFQRAVKLAPGLAWTRLLLAEALIRTAQPVEAGAEIAAAMQREPSNPAVFEEASRLYAAGRQFRGAVDAARRGLQLDPNSASLRRRLAWLLATSADDGLRDGATALRLVEPLAAAPGGRDCPTLMTFAAALAEVGRFEEARRVLAEASPACASSPVLRMKCGFMDGFFASHERFTDVEILGLR